MINTKYDPAPWTNELTPLIENGDDRVLLNGRVPRTACRVIAEENFQYARSRVNAHDDLVKACQEALGAIWELRDWRSATAYEADPSVKKIRSALAQAEGRS